MKKLLLSITMLTIIGMIGVDGQSTLIISENFQEWEDTEDLNPDTCWKGYVFDYVIYRELSLVTSTRTAEIPVTLYMCVIRPECDSRRVQRAEPPGSIPNFPGVTTGWVLLNKLTDEFNTIENFELSSDTLGEFIFGPVPQIDSIVFGHSATGGGRGIRIYKSTDGETWENTSPDDEFWDAADCQLGDVNSVVIDESDVYIKFTSGFDEGDKDSQFARLHNIDVWGVPGVLNNINNTKIDKFNIYPLPAKDFIIVELAEEAVNSEMQIIDIVGKTVYSSVVDRQTSRIDISNLNNGIYFIQITLNDEKYVKQLMVK